MTQSPDDTLIMAYDAAETASASARLPKLPDDCLQELRTIVKYADSHKGVLGVTLTSIVYKILYPAQDVRYHQEGMKNGYSGRGFDTKHVTPFLKEKFPHFAMAESAWLTRSLEQPRPYNTRYAGKIRNKEVKKAFLNTLDRLQTNSELAPDMLVGLLALMIEASAEDASLFAHISVSDDLTIARIVEAVNQHIRYNYGKGIVGTARLPVLAIYSVYNLLLPEVKRYIGKGLAPLESHTSPDARSKSLGDIEVKNEDGSCFEAIEVKHLKPVSVDMVSVAYRKIKDTNIDRYYILTTCEPNFDDQDAVMRRIEEYKKLHPCQIVVNGVIPSLKYYLRLVSDPRVFVDEYTRWLEFEFQRASGIKKEHMQVWQETREQMLKTR